MTEALNFRTGPGTGNSVITVLPAGAQLQVIGGPQSAGGYTWWQLRSGTYGTGWAAGAFLAEV